MKRLTEKGFVFSERYVKSTIDSWSIAQCLRKLQGYEDAEEQGRLVTFPCKEGDEVFALRDSIKGQTIISGTVQKFEIKKGNILVTTTLGMYNAREFGQTVFLNEAALQAAQGGKV